MNVVPGRHHRHTRTLSGGGGCAAAILYVVLEVLTDERAVSSGSCDGCVWLAGQTGNESTSTNLLAIFLLPRKI